MKKSRNFDDWIKENLDQYDPDLKNKDAVWDKLKSTLQNHEHEEKLFDESIKNKFQQFDAKAPKSDWNHFLVKYKERAARRKRILGIRIAELSLVILLLWTFDQFYKQYEPLQKTLHAKFNKQSDIEDASVTRNSLSKNNDQNSNSKISSKDKKANSVKSTLKNQKPNTDKAKPYPLSQNAYPKTNRSITLRNSENQNSDISKVDNVSVVVENTNSSFQNSEVENKNNLITNNPNSAGAIGSNENTDQDAAKEEELALLELKQSEIKFLPNPNYVELPKYKPVLFSDFGIWISGNAGAGINFIKTPQDILLGKHSLSRIGQTSNAGLKIMFDHGRWILESGLNYSFLSDQPKVCDIYKSYSGEFHKTELLVNEYQLLEIPILAHVVVLFTDQINWTIGGGISIAANVSSKYQKHDLLYPERPPQGISFLPRASYLDEKMYNAGLLNREAFNENSFANLILQSRVVYKHRSDVQFFGEIQLKNMLSSYGFGPLSDRYKQLGLNLGISKKI
ncbi:MAG: hypothetical protein IPH93_14145 [Saprospiraceae bacterium]|nr:hypothetical protein [Saprospiraceae bacterium]